MTPSEIAESVDWKAEWELACALRIADRQKSQEIINERDKWIVELINERDEAVALLVPLANMATACGKGADDSVYVGQSGHRLTYGDFRRAFAFLARIDASK